MREHRDSPPLREHSTINWTQFNDVTCWGTDYHLGLVIPDIGYMRDVTGCGFKHLCMHRKCTHKSIRGKYCPWLKKKAKCDGSGAFDTGDGQEETGRLLGSLYSHSILLGELQVKRPCLEGRGQNSQGCHWRVFSCFHINMLISVPVYFRPVDQAHTQTCICTCHVHIKIGPRRL